MRAHRHWPRTTLAENNERWVNEGKQLHPTRGWRKISIRQTRVAGIVRRRLWGDPATIWKIVTGEII